MKNRTGSILVLAVVMVVILLIIGLAMITLASNARLQAVRSQLVIEAKAAADAGLAHAVKAMNAKRAVSAFTWDNSTLPAQTNFSVPGSAAKFTYTVDPNWTVTSTGYDSAGRAQRTVKANLTLRNPFFEGALITRQNCDLKNMVTITSYNPTGDPNYNNVPVRIGSASNTTINGNPPVTVGNNGTISADIVVGAGGDPATLIVNGTSTIGPKYALSDGVVFPAVTVPPNLITGTGITLTTNGTSPILTPINSGQYNSINVSKNGDQLEIQGNVSLYITGDFSMKPGTTLKIDPNNSSLKIYINGNFNMDSGCIVANQTNLAANFMLFGTSTTSQTFNIQPNSNFIGAIYAPNADIIMQPNGTFFGACISNSFAGSNNNFNFTYDKSLSNIYLSGSDLFFVIARWWEE